MASPPPEQNTPVDGDDHRCVEDLQDTQDKRSPARDAYIQHQEISSIRIIPTKTGDEDPVSDTQFERPVSAGTTHSSQYEFDNTDDAAELEKLTYKPNGDEPVTGSIHDDDLGSRFLSRPEPLGAQNVGTGFSFNKPSRQQMDFTSTRLASKQSNTVGPNNETYPNGEDGSSSKEQDHLMHGDDPQQMPPTPYSLPDAEEVINKEDATSASANNDGDAMKLKRKRRGKRRRYETAAEQTNSYTQPSTVDHAAKEQTAGGASLLNDIENFESTTAEPMADVADSVDASTRASANDGRSTRLSSPHEQLQEDLSNATHQLPVVAAAQSQYEQLQSQEHAKSDGLQPEPFSVHGSSPLPARSLLQQTNDDANDINAFHQEADRPILTKGSKKKSKSARRATCPEPREPDVPEQSLSDIIDYVQILNYKIQTREQACAAQIAAQREAMQSNLQQSHESEQALQDELDNLGQHNQALTAVISKQTAKIEKYEEKIKHFKKYVDGVGKDMDCVRKQANSSRRNIDDLALDIDGRVREREILYSELSIRAEQSADLLKQAVKDRRELSSDLELAVAQNEYLNKQLSEKVGLLAEERDRYAQLEQQLASAATSDEKVLQIMKSNSDAILQKLQGMRALLEEAQSDKQAMTLLQETFTAVQDLDSTSAATQSDVACAKELVEKLDERLTSHCKDLSTAHQDYVQDTASSFRTNVDQALTTLKDQLVQREKHLQQDASTREVMKSLEEQLKANNVRMADVESKLWSSEAKETQLKEQNGNLQAQLTALRDNSSPSAQVQLQLSEAEAELTGKIKALESTKTDLAGKLNQLKDINNVNTGLQDQVRNLESRLAEIQTQVVDFGPEREAIEQRGKEELSRVRKEMAEYSEKFETELKIQARNDLKKVTSDRNRFEKQMKSLTEELTSVKAQALSGDKSSKAQELTRLTRVSESQKEEIDTLQESLDDLRERLADAERDGEKCVLLSAQLSTETSKLEKKQEENSTLSRQVESLQRTTAEAHTFGQDAQAELERRKAEQDSTRQELEAQVAQAKETSRREAAGSQQLRESCNSAIREEKAKGERQVKALQERLSEAQTELEKQKSEDEAFRTEVEQSWQHEQDDFAKRYAEIKQSVSDAEAQRDDAVANNERLRQELQATMEQQRNTLMEQLSQLQHRAVTAEEKLNTQPRPSSKTSTTSSAPRVPKLKEGLTPVGGTRATQPSKPRKKADRVHGATVEDGPVPAPDELRPDSRRSNSANSKSAPRGPVVEESQFSNPFIEASEPTFKIPKRRNVPAKHSESDDMLSVRNSGSMLPDTVEETQSQDRLPSFAEFNRTSMSSQELGVKPASSTLSRPPAHGTGRYFGVASGSLEDSVDRESTKAAGATMPQQIDDFTIFEDSQGRDNVSGTLEEVDTGHLPEDSLSWSQEAKNKYTFQKSFPHPNSASKMVHPNDRELQGVEHRHADIPRRDTRARTPEVRGGRGRETAGNPVASRILPGQSSSPDFVHANTRKMSTYHTPNGSTGKRRTSRTSSFQPTDPRLAGRNPPPTPKRKSEGTIVEGYERERKRRLTESSSVAATSRSQVPASSSSQSNLPRFPAMPAGPNRSTMGSQSRMRTLAGGSSRAVRGGKEMSKNDEFNARFSQELGGR